jgi:hypothetical protein
MDQDGAASRGDWRGLRWRREGGVSEEREEMKNGWRGCVRRVRMRGGASVRNENKTAKEKSKE